jgi:hypothetical protein
MRDFHCPTCCQRVFFENDSCINCGTLLGFEPSRLPIVALDENWANCANWSLARCNWFVPAGDNGALCRSCSLTRTRPDDDDSQALDRFAAAEAAKRRLVYQLLDLGLPVSSELEDPELGLAFDLLSSRFHEVVIGHADGVITFDLAEADDAHREEVRHQLGEAYRTVLGHLRHEVGHYYWQRLVGDRGHVDEFRAAFGDERVDYAAAVAAHYGGDRPAGWEDEHVSAYATMHPWEDWAETFAHHLHICDALETAAAFGLIEADASQRPFAEAIADWIPLSLALNAISRSMGAEDLYPFVLSGRVIEKLTFVDGLVRSA